MQRQKGEEQSEHISPTKEKKDKSNIDRIQQTKASLDQVIEELNGKLYQHFHNKEQELIEQYKKELIEAQRELTQLKSTTNEEQIKNKMLERKKELERERHELIQTNMFFSAKCEDYKKKLTDLVAQGKELERELVFLDSQINSAHRKKYQVISQYQQLQSPALNEGTAKSKKGDSTNTLPLFSDRKPNSETPTSKKLANSVSVRQTNKKAILEDSMASKSKRNFVRNGGEAGLSKLPVKQLEKTPLEELFEKTVEQIRDKRKGKRGIPSLKGEQFSDYEKKMIMQEFLSRQEVKKKIYEIIFESEGDRKPYAGGSFQPQSNKIKISYEDIS